VALDVLRRVSQTSSFANLILPKELSARGLSSADAGFVTDAVYGTLRWRGLLDAIIAAAAKRDISKIDGDALDVLRLGAFQVLFMAVPDYAAVNSSVDLTRSVGRGRLTGFVNAVIRKIATRGRKEWESMVVSRIPKEDAFARLAVRYSHPEWIVRELSASLDAAYGAAYEVAHGGVGDSGDDDGRSSDDAGVEETDANEQLPQLLAADNAAPDVTLAARPGLITPDALVAQLPPDSTVRPGKWSPYAVRVHGVNPAHVPAVQEGKAGVEDEGSQLAALALANAPLGDAVFGRSGEPDGSIGQKRPDKKTESAWLDMCAGPGGKTALLGAIAAERGVRVTANEPTEHRARLVEQNVAGLPEGVITEVTRRDGRDFGREMPGAFDRVLVDAPCSGLGALRRRPEARWTKSADDIAELTEIQRGLLNSALDAVTPGGVVAYVTCSPVVAETRGIVDAVLKGRGSADEEGTGRYERLDTAAVLKSIVPEIPLPEGARGDVQLFSHVHDTDQMFISLIRRVR
jgi:16S rRNA (cytosine967-C5)-methyltransferase